MRLQNRNYLNSVLSVLILCGLILLLTSCAKPKTVFVKEQAPPIKQCPAVGRYIQLPLPELPTPLTGDRLLAYTVELIAYIDLLTEDRRAIEDFCNDTEP